ncbi:DNA-binding response regulator [Boudabousia tangfeifanii]|uniref:DNA-binding response regulator n=1 Tax=Boudabousia tangfeifanii TaxID=1912795 RepID=A0A1D9MI97_9ACTO|nr:response regulator transcription factor [Boudabousia tangfeifanii]AOZ72014.1 DNA-binding response regulator [Boudabousia tangfeifanii]
MRLIIADDASLLREGLVGLLERLGNEVIAQVEDATALEAAVEAAANSEAGLPDVVITDVRMPPNMRDDGIVTAVKLREKYPHLSLMILSQYVASEYAASLFTERDSGSGGLGYLLKDRVSRVADFVQSLQVVAAGGVVVDPEVATQLIAGKNHRLGGLTPREKEVLEMMAQGLSNTQIGEKLFLSPAAVSKHVANVFMKLGLGPGEDNRRVRAVLAYLSATNAPW